MLLCCHYHNHMCGLSLHAGNSILSTIAAIVAPMQNDNNLLMPSQLLAIAIALELSPLVMISSIELFGQVTTAWAILHNSLTEHWQLDRMSYTWPPEAICGWSGPAVGDEVINKSRAKRAAKFWT